MMRFFHSSLAPMLCVSLATPSVALASQDPDALAAQQLEYAKAQFAEGQALHDQLDYAGAVEKYEVAYQYAPELHVLSFNIGLASKEGGDCVKARAAFQRFLDLVAEHPKRADAQRELIDIRTSGCADTPEPAPTPSTPPPTVVTTPPPVEDDAPQLVARPKPGVGGNEPAVEESEAAEDQDAVEVAPKKYRFNTQMKAGIGVMASGGLFVAVSGVTALITLVSANKLADLAAETSATGFTPHNYADDAIFRIDQRRKILGVTSIVLVSAGVVAGGVGLGLYLVGLKKCRASDSGAVGRRGRLQLAGLAPAVFAGGGGVGASFSFAGPNRGLPRRTGSTCK